MTEALKVGFVNEVRHVATEAMTAEAVGNPGFHVLSTPWVITMIEGAASNGIEPLLEADQGSVGTRIDVQHIAATPVGMQVVARVEIVEIDGRRIVFKVEARDEVETIMTGTHERFIINSKERFNERASAKTGVARG
jgi:predicted thioesterase